YFGKDEVFDLSSPSTMYPEPVEEEDKHLYSWFVKAGEMHAVPPSITGTYNESQVVLRIPRKCDLYTFSISELQPEQNVLGLTRVKVKVLPRKSQSTAK
ncbi:hypothetical protein Tco_0476835, partial [Tanacetum coccineum]